MRHRHLGPKVKYITRRNNIRYRQRPTHSQMDKYKNLNYKQLRKKFRISPLADDDKDKVPNYKDCRPWDKDKHFLGLFGKPKFQELDYIKRGIKDTANITISHDDPNYESKLDEVRDFAEDSDLSVTVTEKSDGESMHTSIDLSSKPVAEIDWESKDPETIGMQLGYPEKAIVGFADKDREEKIRDVHAKLIDEGISQEDLDLLEFVPYGMDADEVRAEIEKRKK